MEFSVEAQFVGDLQMKLALLGEKGSENLQGLLAQGVDILFWEVQSVDQL